MKNTLAQEWEKFRCYVIPRDAPPDQLREMQLAFYCGMQAMLSLQLDVVGGDGISEEAGMALYNAWLEEIDAFFQAKKQECSHG